MARFGDFVLLVALGFALGMGCTILALDPIISFVWNV